MVNLLSSHGYGLVCPKSGSSAYLVPTSIKHCWCWLDSLASSQDSHLLIIFLIIFPFFFSMEWCICCQDMHIFSAGHGPTSLVLAALLTLDMLHIMQSSCSLFFFSSHLPFSFLIFLLHISFVYCCEEQVKLTKLHISSHMIVWTWDYLHESIWTFVRTRVYIRQSGNFYFRELIGTIIGNIKVLNLVK